jgi:hypothetical protein
VSQLDVHVEPGGYTNASCDIVEPNFRDLDLLVLESASAALAFLTATKGISRDVIHIPY